MYNDVSIMRRFPRLDELAELPGRLVRSLWDGSRDRLVRAILVAGGAATLLAVAVVGWFTQSDRLYQGYAPAQPIPYSHRLHAGQLGIPCQYCHVGATRSRHAGVPAVETCLNCHRVTKTDRPDIQALAVAYRTGRAIAWQRVHALPDHVYFDHRPHVAAGIACQTCHGPVQEMTVLAQNLSLRMAACLACHRNPAAALPAGSPIRRGPEHCNACHR